MQGKFCEGIYDERCRALLKASSEKEDFFKRKVQGVNMALYFITTRRDKAEKAKNEMEMLFEREADIYQFTNIYILMSAAYRKSYIMHTFGEDKVFALGTIFNSKYFNEQLFASYSDINILVDELKRNVFFGHYLVIVARKRGVIELISDKVGIINTYYATDNNSDIYISNDVLFVAKYSDNGNLYRQAVYEFVMTESNVGSNSIFANVNRLKMGYELLVEHNQIKQRKIYDYNIERLNKNEYIERIKGYFNCFRNYSKRIGVDVSAGYDTRLIVSIAKSQLGNIIGFNNPATTIDEEISKVVADRLHIKLHSAKYEEIYDYKKDKTLVLHGTSAMRDADRSIKFPRLFSNKYKICDLALGGYGGECIRAKYEKCLDIKDYITDFYKGFEARKVCRFSNYGDEVYKELNAYIIPNNMNNELLQNWYYAVAKMRIWGAGFIQMSLLYGEVVHPFMDWWLLNPLYGFERNELKNAKLLEELILLFAPELENIPINCHMNGKGGAHLKEKIIKYIKNRYIRYPVKYVYYIQRNLREYKLDREKVPEELENEETDRMLRKLGKSIASKTRTVISAYKYVNHIDGE